MHVLYFHQYFSTRKGSTGTRSYEMAKRLVMLGHQVTVICGSSALTCSGLTQPFAAGSRKGVVDGINVIEFDLGYSNYLSFFKRSILFLRYALRSIAIGLKLDYDLVFASSTPLTAAIPGVILKLLRRKKFIFEVRDLWPELPRAMGVIKNPAALFTLRMLEKSAYFSADACIALSPGIAEGISSTAPAGLSITVIPNACDLTLFTPRKRKDKSIIPGVKNEDFVALFSGAHGIANGLDAVLDVAQVIKQRKVKDIKFVFIGDGKEKPKLLERALDQGLDNCIFLNPLPKEELAVITASVDVGLMVLANVPAFYYGTSPNKFFDYISSGIPVVNNYPGWLAEIIEKHLCGIPVPPEQIGTFSDALLYLKQDPETRYAMGVNARRLAEKQFDRDILAMQFATWLEVHAGQPVSGRPEYLSAGQRKVS